MIQYNRPPLLYHVLFWLGILLYMMLTSSSTANEGFRQIFETYATIVFIQIIVTYTTIEFLIPNYFNRGRKFTFCLLIVLLIFAGFAIYSTLRINYLEVRYHNYYQVRMTEYIKLGFWERFQDMRVVLSKGITYLTPVSFLLLMGYYRNQREYLELKEQKKTAELSALKSQLNPHFLFNTLNNLYALSIKKSDRTPEVISKLSEILDYMLYGCNDKYVFLDKEVELIENYIDLEKIRYGDRASVSLQTDVQQEVKIAPLILLSFVENAFKHGVSQEINTATIDIDLKADSKQIRFSITNSIPIAESLAVADGNSIGLKNVRKQLELIYGNSFLLETNRTQDTYSAQLDVTMV